MTAGFVLRFDIQRITESHDSYGGMTGTISNVYTGLRGRFETIMPEEEQLVQGLEADAHHNIQIRPNNLDVHINDLVIVKTQGHPMYNKQLLIISVQHDNVHPRDRRGHSELVAVNTQVSRESRYD